MTDSEAHDPDADRIREAAATWIARVQGRPSSRQRRAFDHWLAADPRHPAAYQRMAQRFDGAKLLRKSQLYAARPQPLPRPYRARIAVAALAVAVFALIAVLTTLKPRTLNTATRRERTMIAAADAVRGQQIAALTGAVRSIGLQDGSVVTLDATSMIEVAFTPDIRRVKLLRGRARFTVAHDGRPFTVLAGGGSVTARGTIFDVSVSPGGLVNVALLRGIVDVVPAGQAPSAIAEPHVRRLLAGEAVGYARGNLTSGTDHAPVSDPHWVNAAVEFDNVSLAYLLDFANQGDGPPIKLADPSLAALRVSGRFEVGEHERLAQNLARLFDLHAYSEADAILLRRD